MSQESETKAFKELKRHLEELRDETPPAFHPALVHPLDFSELFVAWFLLAQVTGRSNEKEAWDALTEPHAEGGMDAIHIDDDAELVTIVQGKWRTKLNGKSEQMPDVKAFAMLSDDLVVDDQAKVDSFVAKLNERTANMFLKARERVVERGYSAQFCYVTTGRITDTQKAELRRIVRGAKKRSGRDLLQEAFDGSRVIGLFEDDRIGASPPVPNLALKAQPGTQVARLGDPEQPNRTYSMTMNGRDVGSLVEKHRDRIFAQNVRGYLGRGTPVNRAMDKTLRVNPELFFLLNNGITVICTNADREGVDSDEGEQLEVTKPQIINGQQTTYALYGSKNAAEATVFVRVIELPADISSHDAIVAAVVKATNSQNAVKPSDLRSNDPKQIGLEVKLRQRQYEYIRKRGTTAPAGNYSHGVIKIKMTDFAQAYLACNSSVESRNEGIEVSFDSETKYKQIFGQKVEKLLAQWWLFWMLKSQSRGSSERQAAKFLAAEVVWTAIGDDLVANFKRFQADCLAQKKPAGKPSLAMNDLLSALDAQLDLAIEFFKFAASGQSPAPEITPFFKGKKIPKEYEVFLRKHGLPKKATKSKARYKESLDAFRKRLAKG